MPKSTVPKDKALRKSKPRQRTKALRGAVVSAGGVQTADTDNLCMLSFTTHTTTNGFVALNTGEVLRLLPDPLDDREIQIIKDAKNLGRYNGSRKSTLRRCMKVGYKYSARVVAIEGQVISIEIRGEGA